jgi:TPR repeat protein
MWILCARIVAIFLLVVSAKGQVSPTTFQELLKRAESGDATAQFEIGRAYEDGKGAPPDDDRAVEWFRKSAEQGNAQAQNSLGVMYAEGRGVQRDRTEAVDWYRKAAKQGLPEALYNVAIAYYNGEGEEHNTAMACTWMKIAQRKGDTDAAEALKHIEEELNQRLGRCKFDLAGLYEKGDEVPRDLPEAVALYKEAAAQPDGHPSVFSTSAQSKLCRLYFTGDGVPKDYGQAKSWCKKSGESFVYVVMGRMAEEGLEGKKSPSKAMDFYRKAAAAGVPEGFMEAGRLRMESGTHQGEKQAYFWYASAAKRKNSRAAEKLHEIAARLSDKEIAEESKHVDDWYNSPSTTKELKKH